MILEVTADPALRPRRDNKIPEFAYMYSTYFPVPKGPCMCHRCDSYESLTLLCLHPEITLPLGKTGGKKNWNTAQIYTEAGAARLPDCPAMPLCALNEFYHVPYEKKKLNWRNSICVDPAFPDWVILVRTTEWITGCSSTV